MSSPAVTPLLFREDRRNAMESPVFVRRCFTLALSLVTLFSLGGAGCSSESVASCEDDGSCACRDSDCADGERCVQGECRKTCETQDDCPIAQNCAVFEFAGGEREQRCVVLDYAADGSTGHSEPCAADDDCDTPRGYRCIDGACAHSAAAFETCGEDSDCQSGLSCVGGLCTFACGSHFDCGGLGLCESSARGTYCEPSDQLAPGQYYSACPSGPSQCDLENDFICLSYGQGDLDAFCTADCGRDDDCPSGFRCGAASAVPCEDACGEAGSPDAPGCVPAVEIGEGKRYQCGATGLVRPVCVKKAFCSPCESDADCLAVPGQVCAKDASGEKICTVPCAPGADSCPWGNAGECGLFDEELGIPTCSHRFGSCHGEGLGCEPCVNESDCPNGFCARSAFTQEQYCIDLTTSCDCDGDEDASGTCRGHGCPDSPGGPALTCLGVERYDGDPFANHCLGATTQSQLFGGSPQTGCWSK